MKLTVHIVYINTYILLNLKSEKKKYLLYIFFYIFNSLYILSMMLQRYYGWNIIEILYFSFCEFEQF